ncbi:MAG: Smr/MutS family protein, partial [Lachnospiraceae bacterium]|nr:Smr/MutS family protein [Lachnospiraceae bacterium]
ERERREAAEYKDRIKLLESQLKTKNEKLDNAKDKILKEAHEQARAILQEAKNVADETIRSFHQADRNSDMRELEKKRQNLREKIDDKNERLALKTPPSVTRKTLDPKKLKKGDSVRILSMGLKGTVSSLPDAKGNLFVQCGIIRSSVNVNDLVLLADNDTASVKNTVKTSGGKMKMSKTMTISPEINLLGKTCDEAIAMLDKYLDDAYLSHLSSVRVVHGKGTGALRNAVHTHLKRLKYVKEFRLGEFGEGDAGVTIVTFK